MQILNPCSWNPHPSPSANPPKGSKKLEYFNGGGNKISRTGRRLLSGLPTRASWARRFARDHCEWQWRSHEWRVGQRTLRGVIVSGSGRSPEGRVGQGALRWVIVCGSGRFSRLNKGITLREYFRRNWEQHSS